MGDGSESVPIDDLEVGDIVLVRPGARIPADGEVIGGVADVDESMIWRIPPCAQGSGRRGGRRHRGRWASLRIKVTAVGDATALSGIMRLVAEAQAASSRAQALADRAAAILFTHCSGGRGHHAGGLDRTG